MKNFLLHAAALCAPLAAQQPPGPVIEWNQVVLQLLRTPGAQPATVHPTRTLAILHAAIYDAVNSIGKSNAPYQVLLSNVASSASQDAAASSAAHEVLTNLFPAFQSQLDSDYQQSLSSIPDGSDKDAGIAAGKSVADTILALRAGDGSANTPSPFAFGSGPGAYQSTPPNFPSPQFTIWSQVTPFALASANQFRPGPPPDLASAEYIDAFNEIRFLGIAHSTTATADQKLIGVFWNGAIQDYWNEIAQAVATSQQLATPQAARLFALLNIAVADTVIAFYDAKYVYKFWRPVTAIRATADPNWVPEVKTTAADPSYPGAHGAISAAAATVLAFFFGSDQFGFTIGSEVFAGTERSFSSFSSASTEAFLSRIYAGQHFRFDQEAGAQLGANVADFVTANLLGAN
jgi:membrane-associated phospholipid phosphatase